MAREFERGFRCRAPWGKAPLTLGEWLAEAFLTGSERIHPEPSSISGPRILTEP